MPLDLFKKNLILLHRWLGLALTPLFLIIALSGAVLAVKPILDDIAAPGAASGRRVEPQALVSTLNIADPQGKSMFVTIEDNGGTAVLRGKGAPPKAYDIASARPLQRDGRGFELFGTARQLHKALLLDAGIAVEIATYVMAVILIFGPLLAWPRLRNSVMGWHMGMGWLLYPLLVLSPVTAIMLVLHIGTPGHAPGQPPQKPLPLASAIDTARDKVDLGGLSTARGMRGGVMLSVRSADGVKFFQVSADGTVVPTEPALVKQLHEGTWAGAWSGAITLLVALALTGLTATGFYSWFRRYRQGKRRTGDKTADVLVAHASQTGTAARLAEATATALRAGGHKVVCAALGTIRPDELSGFRHNLLIVSTTGAGELPDQGRAFLERLQETNLSTARFAMLALGDRRYEHFCGGGESLRSALAAASAVEALPMLRLDGNPQQGWRDWLASLGPQLGLRAAQADIPSGDMPLALTLAARHRLDDPALPGLRETWAIHFESALPADYRPGDLLLVPSADGSPDRCYSIGSSPHRDGRMISLTVALHHWQDAQGRPRIGQVSGMLCRNLEPGRTIAAALRRHPGFNPPDDSMRPLIMVAAGAGIAPFPGFLAERAAAPSCGPAWLLFGNNRRNGDFFHRATLEDYRAAGILTRIDAAFYADAGDGAFIQARMVENGAEILRWLRDGDAVLYVCGRAGTLGVGVDQALTDILIAQDGASPLQAEQILTGWTNSGKIRRDLFD